MVPRPAHLGHRGEAELLEVLQDLMVEVGRHSPQTGNVQPLVTAGQLNKSEGGCEGRDGFDYEGDLKSQTFHYQVEDTGHTMTI